MKAFILAEASRLGFAFCGVTTMEQPAHYPAFINWLEAGRHGSMAYLETERSRAARTDLSLLLPEARSVIVLGFPYPSRFSQEKSPLQVSSYAQGKDYHEVIRPRLIELGDSISSFLARPVKFRGYTDTGPIMERDLAQRAGLGWIGKNTCLIRPGLGSYFFLSELLVGLDLEPDPPFTEDRCGSCSRCIQACPTGCILPDRTIDARRCISYLTIENKDLIPQELRSRMGTRLFGCDACQQVCPWNRFAAQNKTDPAFNPLPGWPPNELSADLMMTAQEFNRKFQLSPVMRAKRRGYLRNLSVALGNLGDHSLVGSLSEALQEDMEPLVRGHAAWALGQLGGPAARAALEQAVRLEKDPEVLVEIQSALLILDRLIINGFSQT